MIAPEQRLWPPASTTTIAEKHGGLSRCWPLRKPRRTFRTLHGAYFDVSLELLRELAITVDVDAALPRLSAIVNKMRVHEGSIQPRNTSGVPMNPRFEDIIGESPALGAVLEQVERVAPTDSTVLIRGETGTGKELIARAIHDRSPRRERTVRQGQLRRDPDRAARERAVRPRAAAPSPARIAQRIGRFELADGGTLFLDEIGDIPLELQAKLLRVLQEQEFERVGGTRTIRRRRARWSPPPTATSRTMVADGTFREDLYYRLNVFPIRLPPLRERREDIPLLVPLLHRSVRRRVNKRIDSIPRRRDDARSAPTTGRATCASSRTLIERAVILADGGVLPNPLPLSGAQQIITAPPLPPTFRESERALILNALEGVGWVIGGGHGAATRLGLNRTTLINKMKKLGITRPAPRPLGDRPGCGAAR